MNEFALGRLSVGSSTHQTSLSGISPVESHFSSGSATSESIVASPLDIKSDPEECYAPIPSEPPQTPISPNGPPTTQKRKRGRPRKHPIVPLKPKNGRSRTGCITCRKRKKKCDETRPECLNCKHMNKVCEGFYLPERWQSGRHKPESRRPSLPALINGVECDEDRMLLDHFMLNVSHSLCLCADQKSPFNTLIVPMALQDVGLMHSVLCLSGYQLASNYSKSQIPESVRPDVIKRRLYHLNRAISLLIPKVGPNSRHSKDPGSTDDTTIAHITMLFLQTIVAGDRGGQHTCHLNAGCELALSPNFQNPELKGFMTEFFAYHDITCSITSPGRKSSFISDTFRLPEFVPPAAGSYLGVLDGLFINISKITNLREHIRQRRSLNLEPLLDSATLHTAHSIDAELREWICRQQEDTPREMVSQLYRQCTWIYLYRTIYISGPVNNLIQGVEDGLSFLTRLKDDDSLQPVLLMPVFLLGCAAFDNAHRPDIEAALDLLESKRGNGNIKHVRTVIHEVWHMMDTGDRDSWDWESVMSNMNLDFQIS